MICTNCTSPYSAPYESFSAPASCSPNTPCSIPRPMDAQPLCEPAPTINPALPPACQDGVSPYPIQPPLISSPPRSTFPQYRFVSQLPTQTIYGHQGPNGSVICGMKPLYSVPVQSMWNAHPMCPPTESKLTTNVSHYDDYQSTFSVTNPITQKTLPTLAALLCPENIVYLKTNIEDMLTKTFGFAIGIEDTPAFRQTINDVAIDNPRWMYNVDEGLPLLNHVIIQREFGVHQVAVRQQLLYQKYMIEQNRQKYMPYGTSDHTKKGDSVNDASSYALNQPVPISYDCFLTQANLRCKH